MRNELGQGEADADDQHRLYLSARDHRGHVQDHSRHASRDEGAHVQLRSDYLMPTTPTPWNGEPVTPAIQPLTPLGGAMREASLVPEPQIPAVIKEPSRFFNVKTMDSSRVE